MRFFAHDGQTVHGPSRVEELTRLPNFDGDTLVCPVGSENSADWKPALAYPPFRAVLLAPQRKPAPVPPPPAPTAPCPRCASRNPEKARFCNDCGARMDGREASPAPAPAAPAPAAAAAPIPIPAPTPVPPSPAPADDAALDPFRLPPSNVEFPAPAPAVELAPAEALAPVAAAP
ncbi:MAG: hypothetical protein KGL74_11665, partial [Elusimicrobia bacterium]|nr:hypothetical protein [Elusimicrobiota bacterium]